MPGHPSPLADDVRAPAAALGAADDDDRAVLGPLSYPQEWLWYLDQLEPARSTYGVTHAWRIRGPLDVDALRKGLQWLVDRHASLRTTFVVVDGVPRQRVAQHREFVLAVDDLGAVAADARDAAAAAIARDEARRPFDLVNGPLFSGRLLRLDATRHWLLLPRHHTISGGWRDLATRELSIAYNAFAAGDTPQLPPLALQYLDYARWQRDTLQGEYLAQLESYWRQRLAGAPTALALPTDRRRPPVRQGDGARIRFTLAAERVDALRALARATGATLHMTLLAAFHVLLARYTGQDDILVGAPVSGRERADFDGVMGMFINTVVHRGELGADPTFRAFVGQTAASAAEAYRHQALPIGRLVQALAPKRDAGRNPLFQAMYSLQDRYETSVPLTFVGTTSEPVDTYNGTSKVDLSLLLLRDGPRLQGMLEYATDLFNADTIETMAGQFVALVDEIARDPDRRVGALSLLRLVIESGIVVDWNATSAPYPADRTVHALFSEQARRTPAAIALVAGEWTLDYATLDRNGDALARRLRDSGIAPRSRVGICAGRSIEGVVAMLGVLKAGCAYVPLDPDHPAPRIAMLLNDAGAAAVVAVPSATEALSAWSVDGKPVLLIESLDDAPGADQVEVTTGSDELACVMYTSGSTGAPKGVAVPHRAIARLCLGTDYVQLRASDVVAHLANPAFDAATFEIWAPLLNGASVALLGTDTVLAGDAFATALDQHRVTTLFLTTALFNHVVRETPRALNGRQVLFGGEAADPRTVHACLTDARPRRLLHVYGPTETTTFATWHEVVAGTRMR
jgi:non-ribosomal peptide synthetase component F